MNLAGESRQLLFPRNFFGNKRLTNHSITTKKVSNLGLCELQCYHESNGVSMNFKVIPESEGLHECELNNATHRSQDNELKNKDGYVHKGAEVRKFNIPFRFFPFLYWDLTLAFGFMFESDMIMVEFNSCLC